MTASRCDLHCAARAFLSLDLGEVRAVRGRRGKVGLRKFGGGDRFHSREVAKERIKIIHRVYRNAADRCRLGDVPRGNEHLFESRVARAERAAEDAANGAQLSREGKLADEHAVRKVGIRRKYPARLPYRGDHRKIERRALLAPVRGREVYYDLRLRKRSRAVFACRGKSSFRFAHSIIGKSDYLKIRKIFGKRAFDRHNIAVDPEKPCRISGRKQSNASSITIVVYGIPRFGMADRLLFRNVPALCVSASVLHGAPNFVLHVLHRPSGVSASLHAARRLSLRTPARRRRRFLYGSAFLMGRICGDSSALLRFCRRRAALPAFGGRGTARLRISRAALPIHAVRLFALLNTPHLRGSRFTELFGFEMRSLV